MGTLMMQCCMGRSTLSLRPLMLSMSFYYTTFTSRVVLSFHLSVKQHVQGPREIPITTLPPLSSSSHMAKQLQKKRIVCSCALSTVDDSEHDSTVEKIPQQVVRQCGKKSKTLDSKSTSAVTSGSGSSQSKELTNQNRESKDQGGDSGSESNDDTKSPQRRKGGRCRWDNNSHTGPAYSAQF